MKKLQRLGLATVFSFVLTSSTLAGEIHTPGIAQPTPTPTPNSSSAMVVGEIPTGENSSTDLDVSESTSFTGVAFDLLQIVLSVF
ncbi:MAG: hypothetical protein LC794_06780 [Acidobacteria bacterium]|nr:hypothetical protein [Acidobacteriota bacterium]